MRTLLRDDTAAAVSAACADRRRGVRCRSGGTTTPPSIILLLSRLRITRLSGLSRSLIARDARRRTSRSAMRRRADIRPRHSNGEPPARRIGLSAHGPRPVGVPPAILKVLGEHRFGVDARRAVGALQRGEPQRRAAQGASRRLDLPAGERRAAPCRPRRASRRAARSGGAARGRRTRAATAAPCRSAWDVRGSAAAPPARWRAGYAARREPTGRSPGRR